MKIFYHPVTALIVTLFVIFFYISLYQTQKRFQSTADTLAEFSAQNDMLKEEVGNLENRLEIATSSAYKEKLIRDQLLMQKPGEYVVQLPELENFVAEPSVTPRPSPWQEWKELVF